ncbi:winged helix-turn-helix domain-containing protein [Pseudoalteromonas luteoviolacea]|uniref:OmpR/PhoB-type domain-containing protein n=1 Tax=Pseudoalteromonas luteoviolacea NCIMB 1942 TaxID=1365253 RepID=A0A167BD04_9GAMM|nr:winged helix-turn-helix domain-containing protein [Pseudoalteromonas luteoviolacea]KZN46392.1 hypothetical protein N482_12880 [Pseudoalteromonas luteoviolacea NCIMB 1942]
MRYYFEKYYFDHDTFTLYYNEKPRALKSNEAKLLALFIKNTDQILSKEQILDEIWGQQVVSEQVVFQNISHLRRVFGNDAIKTFPKKGYQWQLPFEVRSTVDTEKALELSGKRSRPLYYLYSIITLLVIVILALLLWFSFNESPAQTKSSSKLYVVPFSFSDSLNKSQVARFNTLIAGNKAYRNDGFHLSSLDTTDLFRYSDIAREQAKLDNTSMLLSGYVSNFDEQIMVEYKILGAKRDWHGYIIAQSEELIATSLDAIFDSLHSSGYLSEPNPALLAAKLRLLLEQQPNDLSIIYHLIRQQINNQNYDIARALIEKLIILSKKQLNLPYTVLGLYLKGGILHQQHAYEHASQYYNQALDLLEDTSYSDISYHIELALAWLAYAQHNQSEMQHHIRNATKYAEQSNDVLSQVSAQTTGSILSHKLGDLVNRYQYLNTAKSLLITYEVEEAYFAIIFYHLALFSPNKTEAESYFLKLLGLKKLSSYQWVYESSIEDLLTLYIEKGSWEQALSLFKTQPESSFNLNQKARVLRAQQDFSGAMKAANQAFYNARLNYEHNNALHSALLLYQMQPYMSELKAIEYKNYIKESASKFWLKKHRIELTELGYFDDLVSN